MDKYEKRRTKLKQLIKEKCDGVNAKLARDIGKDQSYVNRMLYAEGKAGRKRIGEDTADLIEKTYNLPPRWLDSDESDQLNIDTRDTELVNLIKLMQGIPLEERKYIHRFLNASNEQHKKNTGGGN